MKKKILAMIGAGCLLAGTAYAEGNIHWGYAGAEGPEFWGSLSDKFATCKDGKSQSPVNIDNAGSIEAKLPAIAFNYSASPMKIVNNGHTIQVNYSGDSTITVEGKTFKLVQFHFHTPSENQIDGKAYPMEAHFVHADAKGNLAVIGVMYDKGAADKVVADIWGKMPTKGGETVELASTINAMDMLPANKDYYRFDGSLTTPPCTEGVTWMVMKSAKTVSEEQTSQFAGMFHGNNARPVQAVNARVVLK